MNTEIPGSDVRDVYDTYDFVRLATLIEHFC